MGPQRIWGNFPRPSSMGVGWRTGKCVRVDGKEEGGSEVTGRLSLASSLLRFWLLKAAVEHATARSGQEKGVFSRQAVLSERLDSLSVEGRTSGVIKSGIVSPTFYKRLQSSLLNLINSH